MPDMTSKKNAVPALIPYGQQWIDDDDIRSVVEVLKSDWLTCGPKVEEFETALARAVNAPHAVAIANGTAALHAVTFALGIGPGDEVIVPPITFLATANCVMFQGGTPVFADVEPESLLLDPKKAEKRITKKTKAIITVDYAGLPCDYDAFRDLAARHGLVFVADGCHALGATYRGRPVGSLADLTCFSFHPVKHITTGEGGMITTAHAEYAQRMRDFRTHGIVRDAARLGAPEAARGPWYYEMQDLGYNYRLSDIGCALGLSQLRKLDRFVQRRRDIAARYNEAFAGLKNARPLKVPPDTQPSWHLYVLQIGFAALGKTRVQVIQELRERGVGSQVHYAPVHLHPFYRTRLGTGLGLCPVAEAAYEKILSLPLFPKMTDEDVERVVAAVKEVVG